MPRISREPVFVVALMAALLALFHLTTTPVTANGGLGYDGVFYARIVETLRTGSPSDGFAPYSFRLLPAAIVAWSGLDVRLGFYVLNVASIIASALVLLAFLRDAKVPQTGRIVATLWWAVLPFTLRWVVLYPVLVDGVGLFFLSLVLWSAYRRSLSLFALSLALGVLARENLILLAPLAFLRERAASRLVRAASSVLPAVLVLAAIHLWPPIPPDPASMSTTEYIGLNARMLLGNIDALPLRLAAAPVLALGALSAVVIARPRACWRVLTAEPGWTYFVTATIAAAALGGRDHDRYLTALAPVGLVVTARVVPSLSRVSASMGLLVLVHLLASRVTMPLAGDPDSYREFMVATMSLDSLATEVTAIVFVLTVAVVVLQRARLLAWLRSVHLRTPRTSRARDDLGRQY